MNVKTNYNEFSFLSFIYLFIFIPDEYTLIKAKEICNRAKDIYICSVT
jgi:hypothetical protein